jgi:hypothetical protein
MRLFFSAGAEKTTGMNADTALPNCQRTNDQLSIDN